MTTSSPSMARPRRPTVTSPSVGQATERRVNVATRRTVSALGAVFALAGIEHGIGEIRQGAVAPAALVFPSWPDAEAFRLLQGEPAMSLVPNLLVTGILAVVVSLLFLAWATLLVQRERAGLVLILLAVLMLLVGGGIFPPLIGLLLGAAATRLRAPLIWWRTHLPGGFRRRLAALWPWFLGADLIAWLSLLPGVVLVSAVAGADAVPVALLSTLLVAAFGFLPLALIAGLARDSHPGGAP
jgi:hypothetical protein